MTDSDFNFNLNHRLERIEKILEALTKAQLDMTHSQGSIAEAQRALTHNLEQLTGIHGQLIKNQEQLNSHIASTNAAVERLERVLDYLLRRDGERL